MGKYCINTCFFFLLFFFCFLKNSMLFHYGTQSTYTYILELTESYDSTKSFISLLASLCPCCNSVYYHFTKMSRLYVIVVNVEKSTSFLAAYIKWLFLDDMSLNT